MDQTWRPSYIKEKNLYRTTFNLTYTLIYKEGCLGGSYCSFTHEGVYVSKIKGDSSVVVFFTYERVCVCVCVYVSEI